MSGQRVLAGRYRLDAVIGQGGMGTVWRGYDLRLDRPVAVKELRLGARLSDAEAASVTAMAVAEARRSAQLVHPHIVTTFDVVDEDGKPWLVMQLVAGRSLAQVIAEQGRLPVPRVAQVGVQVLSGIAAAHAMGIIHRDVKPANILIADSDGAVLLSDFSIAKALREGGTGATTGTMVGSPGFVAPELLLTGHVGPEGDLFGLGACLFQAVEGYGAFARQQPIAGLFASASSPHPAMQHAGDLTPVIDGLLVKDPAHRMSADAALAALTAIASGGISPTAGGTPPVVADTIIRPRRPAAPGPVVMTPGGAPASGIHDQPTQHPDRRPPAPSVGATRTPWWRRAPVLVSAVSAVAIGGAAAAVVLTSPTHHGPGTLLKPTSTATIGPAAAPPQQSSPNAGHPFCGNELAFLGPLSGSLSDIGNGMADGARLAVTQFNDKYGAGCVTLVGYDSASSLSGATTAANRIVADGRALGVIGPAYSPESKVVDPALDAAGIPLISPAATEADLSDQGWRAFHRAIGTDDEVGAPAARYIRDTLHATGVYLIDDGTAYGIRLATGVRGPLAGLMVGSATVARDDSRTNFSTVAAAVVASGADVLLYAGYDTDAGRIRRALTKLGWHGTVVGGDAMMQPGYLTGAGVSAAEGTIYVVPDPPISAAPASFANAFRDAYGFAPTDASDVTYDLANIYLKGIAAGHTTPAAMLTWLGTYDGVGVAHRYRFTANGDLDPSYVQMWVYRVSHGRFVLVSTVPQS